MTKLQQLQYVGGPFAGGTAPDAYIDRIDIHSPAGIGAYVLTRDEETGTQVYRWQTKTADQSAAG